MTTTQVFRNDNGQVLVIPHELINDKKEFIVSRIGDILVAYPSDDPWYLTRQVIGTFPEDFMSDREQPSLSDEPGRESMDFDD